MPLRHQQRGELEREVLHGGLAGRVRQLARHRAEPLAAGEEHQPPAGVRSGGRRRERLREQQRRPDVDQQVPVDLGGVEPAQRGVRRVGVHRHHRVEPAVPPGGLGDQSRRRGRVEQVGRQVGNVAAQLGQERRHPVRVAAVGLGVVVAGQAGQQQPPAVRRERAGDRRADADAPADAGHQGDPFHHDQESTKRGRRPQTTCRRAATGPGAPVARRDRWPARRAQANREVRQLRPARRRSARPGAGRRSAGRSAPATAGTSRSAGS